MIQQKVRKKKRPVLMFIQERSETKRDCPMYSKQTNKMGSLKSLVTLKCESRTSLHVVQYK